MSGKSLCDTCLVRLGKRPRATVEPEVCECGIEMECPDYFPEVNEFLRRMDLILATVPKIDFKRGRILKHKGIVGAGPIIAKTLDEKDK